MRAKRSTACVLRVELEDNSLVVVDGECSEWSEEDLNIVWQELDCGTCWRQAACFLLLGVLMPIPLQPADVT